MKRATVLLLTTLGAASRLPSQPVHLEHAKVEQRPAPDGPAPIVRSLSTIGGTAWLAWAVPGVTRATRCCYESIEELGPSPCGRCDLETRGTTGLFGSGRTDCGEPGGEALFFLKLENGDPSRLRVFSRECIVEARGERVLWLTGVPAWTSVAFLETLLVSPTLEEKKGKRAAEPVMAAIAAHADPTADAALERLASADRPLKVRKQAAFWLGTARSRFGFKALKRLSTDPAEDFRRYLTFALSQSAVPESVDTLIRMARVDESPRVRGQALFWLAQKAGDRAAAAIDNAIREDPDTEVKRQAVFALTQLPKEKGIPQLIRVARTNRNPAVRKQAVFWLGQSKDPRALDFIEEILTR